MFIELNFQRAEGLWVWSSGSSKSFQCLNRKTVPFPSVRLDVYFLSVTAIYIYPCTGIYTYTDTSQKEKNWNLAFTCFACLERAIYNRQDREIYLKTYGNGGGAAWSGCLSQHGVLPLNPNRSWWGRAGCPMLGLGVCTSSAPSGQGVGWFGITRHYHPMPNIALWVMPGSKACQRGILRNVRYFKKQLTSVKLFI